MLFYAHTMKHMGFIEIKRKWYIYSWEKRLNDVLDVEHTSKK